MKILLVAALFLCGCKEKYGIGECFQSNGPVDRWESSSPIQIIKEAGNDSYRTCWTYGNGNVIRDYAEPYLYFNFPSVEHKVACPQELIKNCKDKSEN